jgi:hypothetical protein
MLGRPEAHYQSQIEFACILPQTDVISTSHCIVRHKSHNITSSHIQRVHVCVSAFRCPWETSEFHYDKLGKQGPFANLSKDPANRIIMPCNGGSVSQKSKQLSEMTTRTLSCFRITQLHLYHGQAYQWLMVHSQSKFTA